MRWRIILYTGLFIIANLITLLPPLLFGAFVSEIQASGVVAENLNYLLLLLSGIFLSEIFFWVFHVPARIIERSVAFWAEIRYRKHLLGGVLDLGLTWHGEHDSGDTIDRVNKAGDAMAQFGQNIFQINQLVIKLIGTSVVLFWFSPAISIFAFGLVLVSFLLIFQFDRYLIPQYRELNEFSNKAMASVFDALSNVTSVKILHIESPILRGILGRFTAPYELYQSNSKLNEAKWFAGAVLFQIIAVVPIGFYIYDSIGNGRPVDAGTISALYLYLSNLIYVYFGFTGFYQELIVYKNRVLNAKPIEDAFPKTAPTKHEPTGNWKELHINNLTFAYQGGDRAHLDTITLHIRHGERIAVIGESGSGKTTFLKVLHGLYPTAHSLVSFDDSKGFATSFADLDLKTMLVPQEPEIFSSTIRENITLGAEYSEAEIQHAIRVANFGTVVQELPRGLDSVINEKGVNLSGGQKQRLALSRALLFAKDKEIILLDESTSSVDAENEAEIYTNISEAFAGKTVIASIHKMNLLKFFDRIYMFERGRIVDEGSFEELLERNVSFKKAWKQFVKTGRE